jgi:hypothetical protein
MKKVVFILVAMMAFTEVSAQSVKFNYDFPYISGYGWSFNLPVGGFPEIGELGFIHIETDSIGHIWLKYNVIDIANVASMVDEDGRKTLGRYAVQKGKHIYLKLDNDTIITLTCHFYKERHNGYYVGENDIYNKYDVYSYFNLDDNTINQLRSHNIIKMRVEVKYDVIDANFKGDYPEFEKHYNKTMDKFYAKLNKNRAQQELNNNPLSGF